MMRKIVWKNVKKDICEKESKCVKKIKKYGCVQNKKKNENIISLIK